MFVSKSRLLALIIAVSIAFSGAAIAQPTGQSAHTIQHIQVLPQAAIDLLNAAARTAGVVDSSQPLRIPLAVVKAAGINTSLIRFGNALAKAKLCKAWSAWAETCVTTQAEGIITVEIVLTTDKTTPPPDAPRIIIPYTAKLFGSNNGKPFGEIAPAELGDVFGDGSLKTTMYGCK